MGQLQRALALPFLVVATTCLGADRLEYLPYDGVLLLRNGYVLQGRITPVQDAFLVAIGAGGEVRLTRAEIEFECRTLEEAYFRQRDSLESDTVSARLKLAEWCLRHGLLHRAADQLLAAFIQEPSHPRLAVLEQRLLSLAATVTSSAGSTPTPAVASTPTKSVAQKITPQAMQQFTTIVQPILLNRCATHTCHGNAGTSSYRLIRPASGHAATSRMTQRNLQATLSFMDHAQPESSPLLVQSAAAHGGADGPPFSEKQVHQFELLSAWVRRTAVTPQPAIATSGGGPKRGSARSEASPTPSTEFATPQAGSAEQPPSGVVRATHVAPATQAPATARPTTEANGPGRDPFDGEVFNQRYR